MQSDSPTPAQSLPLPFPARRADTRSVSLPGKEGVKKQQTRAMQDLAGWTYIPVQRPPAMAEILARPLRDDQRNQSPVPHLRAPLVLEYEACRLSVEQSAKSESSREVESVG